MKATKTYEEIFEFIAIAQQWMIKDKGANAESKLGYAIQKMMGRLKKPQKRYHARAEEIQIDTCLVYEGESTTVAGKRFQKGMILKDERGALEYDKLGIKERNAKIQELSDAEIEIEPHIATQLPRKANNEIDLTYAEREAFDGFVLVNSPETDEPQAEALAEQPSVS